MGDGRGAGGAADFMGGLGVVGADPDSEAQGEGAERKDGEEEKGAHGRSLRLPVSNRSLMSEIHASSRAAYCWGASTSPSGVAQNP